MGLFRSKKKMHNVLIGVFLCMIFFVRSLVFDLWSILYFIVVNSVMVWCRVFCDYAVDANLFRLLSSILKHEGSRGAAPGGRGWGSEAPHKNGEFRGAEPPNMMKMLLFSVQSRLYLKN